MILSRLAYPLGMTWGRLVLCSLHSSKCWEQVVPSFTKSWHIKVWQSQLLVYSKFLAPLPQAHRPLAQILLGLRRPSARSPLSWSFTQTTLGLPSQFKTYRPISSSTQTMSLLRKLLGLSLPTSLSTPMILTQPKPYLTHKSTLLFRLTTLHPLKLFRTLPALISLSTQTMWPLQKQCHSPQLSLSSRRTPLAAQRQYLTPKSTSSFTLITSALQRPLGMLQ